MNIIHIQGVGDVPAVMAKELRPKDRIILDGGYRYTVVLVEESMGYVSIGARDHAGHLHVIRRRPEKWVGLAV